MSKFLFIAIGGAAGALLRYSVSGVAYKYLDGMLPWGTLAVNLIGCFFIGFLWQIFEFITSSPNMRSLIFVGILGAFTTFSTYGLETLNLFREGEIKYGLLNVIASNVLGIGLVLIGFIMARYLIGGFR